MSSDNASSTHFCKKHSWKRIAVSAILLYVVLWLPPMDISKKLADELKDKCTQSQIYYILESDNELILESDNELIRFFLAEHEKVSKEIAQRIAHGHDAFKYKFIFIGFIFFSAFTLLGLKSDLNNNRDQLDEYLKILIQSQYASVLLALCVVISIFLDIYERNNVIVTNQLGTWVAHCFEARFTGGDHFGWEQFIREEDGLQKSIFYSIFHWPSNHVLTVFLYALYLLVVRQVCSKNGGEDRNDYMRASLAIVHLAIVTIAIAGHSIPGTFVFKIFGKECEWYWVTLAMVAISVVIVFLNRCVAKDCYNPKKKALKE